MTSMITAPVLLDLLPRDLRGELCIADIRLSGPGNALTFRMDPGRAFERHCTITANDDGWYDIGIADRHRPGDRLADVAGTNGVAAASVPDELRGAAGRAWSRADARDHWRDTFGGAKPEVLAEWFRRSVNHRMSVTAKRIAEDNQIVCFLCPGDVPVRCLTIPPRDAVTFLSVTPQGAWSLHHGTSTYPVSGPPGAGTLTAIGLGEPDEPRRLRVVRDVPVQVRLACGDFPDLGPPTVVPVQRGPTPTRDQAKPDQRRRRGR